VVDDDEESTEDNSVNHFATEVSQDKNLTLRTLKLHRAMIVSIRKNIDLRKRMFIPMRKVSFKVYI
jgi:hypothetical protein